MKVSGKSTCPGCNKAHPVEFDFDKLDIKTPDSLTEGLVTGTGQTLVQPEPKIVEKEVIKTVNSPDEPFFVCKNGNCGEGVHRNENYSKKPNKKCKNCDSLNGNKKCKNCGNVDVEEFDELDDEDLTELGIPMPPEPDNDNHEEHNHE